MLHEHEVREHIEADDIYIGEAPKYVVCTALCTTNKEALKIHKQIEARHGVLNKHVKNWVCLRKRFVRKGTPVDMMDKHNIMFCACVVVKQIAMEMGVGELYKIHPFIHPFDLAI